MSERPSGEGARRVLCAHADQNGEGAHWKNEGEPCCVELTDKRSPCAETVALESADAVSEARHLPPPLPGSVDTEWTDRRCPRCGSHLLESVEHDAEWCSYIHCAYGIDSDRPIGANHA